MHVENRNTQHTRDNIISGSRFACGRLGTRLHASESVSGLEMAVSLLGVTIVTPIRNDHGRFRSPHVECAMIPYTKEDVL